MKQSMLALLEQTEKQHAKGKKTARERIEMLVDPDSFTEIDELLDAPCD
jgi:acetyl-CoA carboxylase carboxyltransferase component